MKTILPFLEMTAYWKREEKKLCQYIINNRFNLPGKRYNTSGIEEILNTIFDLKSSSYFNIHSKVQMYDNLNPPHTHTAYTTNNECQIS